MTIQELYDAIEGNYAGIKRVLPSDALIQNFILKFLEDTTVERLAKARDDQDASELFEAAHALKGICANLGLDALSRLASVVADEYRPQKPRTMSDEAIGAYLDEFEEKYRKTVDTIAKFKASL
ncbi:MAG: Hpt domain-containing protein [Desulfovibrio sp.]|nr:Hpt domain-containing protein [Desulfovibrio sp.]